MWHIKFQQKNDTVHFYSKNAQEFKNFEVM